MHSCVACGAQTDHRAWLEPKDKSKHLAPDMKAEREDDGRFVLWLCETCRQKAFSPGGPKIKEIRSTIRMSRAARNAF